MVKTYPLNVAKYDEISSKFKKSTPINSKGIELKDQLQGKYYITLDTLCLYSFSFKIYPPRR
jgi:hypothetical protein